MNWQSLDIQVFHAINGLANQWPFLDRVLILADKYGVVFFSLVILFYFFRNRRVFWFSAFSAIMSRGVMAELIRYFYNRPRPFVALQNVKLLIAKNGQEPSFPSGHAAYFFAIAFAVYLFDKRVGRWLILLALILSFARIYLGVHYPLDIVGGMAAAALAVFLVKKFRRSTA